jgi:hypothetical protein
MSSQLTTARFGISMGRNFYVFALIHRVLALLVGRSADRVRPGLVPGAAKLLPGKISDTQCVPELY